VREYSVFNVCGVIVTTNYKSDGIFLSADDRRHYIAWSERSKDDFSKDYWDTLWRWYDQGGVAHVAAYLAALSTATEDACVLGDASRAPEDAELADAIDRLGNPDATTIHRIANAVDGETATWIRDRNRRTIPHRLEAIGYVPVRNELAKDGLWVINGKRQAVYAKSILTISDHWPPPIASQAAAGNERNR
jgi:hypothetical protein